MVVTVEVDVEGEVKVLDETMVVVTVVGEVVKVIVTVMVWGVRSAANRSRLDSSGTSPSSQP